jgi:DNA-binding transcriptional MerR regulator
MTTADTQTFTIDELAGLAQRWLVEHGLDAHYYRRVQDAPSERTIRYYRTLGLLDEPIKSGRDRRYTRRHMLQLVAIKALQTRGLSHDRIQSELYAKTDPELEAIIASAMPRGGAEPPTANVLHEYALAPGLRIVADPEALAGNTESDRAALLARFESVLDALAGGPSRRRSNDRQQGDPTDV